MKMHLKVFDFIAQRSVIRNSSSVRSIDFILKKLKIKISKFLITFFLLNILCFKANGEDLEIRYGVKLSPLYSTFNTEGKECSCKGALGFEAGFFTDFIFRTNHAIDIGLYYFMNRMNLKIKNEDYKLNISYLNLPLLLKFHSNEFWIDTQIFLFTGIVFGYKLAENTPEEIADNKKLFKTIRTSFIIGGGIEYEFAMSTSAFLEFGYKTDIFDITNPKKKKDITLKSLYGHSFLITLGIRF